MKKSILSIVALAALVVLPMSVSAQNFVNTNNANDENSTAAADASAKIITPIKVELISGKLDFGTIVSPPANDEVTITPGNVRSAKNDEEILISTTETGGVPTFKVSGQVGYAFSILLPEDDDVTLTAGAKSLVVKTFAHNNAETNIVSGGTEFQVGATLVVPKDQTPDTYTGSFNVIVAYN